MFKFAYVVIFSCVVFFLNSVFAAINPGTPFWEYYNIDPDEAKTILFSQPDKKRDTLPFFESNMPPNLSEKSSFVLSAERGAGKSSLWLHLKRKLLRDPSVFIIEPIDNPSWLQIALEVFIRNTIGRSKVESHTWIAKQWQEKDMIDFIISRISSVILENFDKLNVRNLSKDDRYKLFAITCLYYPDDSVLALEPLKKLLKSDLYFFSPFDFKDISSFQENTADYQYILKLSNNIDVLEKTHTDKLKILCNTLRYFNIAPMGLIPVSVSNNNVLNSNAILLDYIDIIEKAGLKVVLILDGIDEVPMFGILNQACSADPFKTVIKSTKPLLDMATTQLLQLILFVPDCPGISTKTLLPEWRDSKIMHFSLSWDKAALSDYANFILDFLRTKQGWVVGHSLPLSFSELVGGDRCANLFFNKVSNPRQFNALFAKFILQLNLEKNIDKIQSPFLGSQTCSTIKNAINIADNNQDYSGLTKKQKKREL